MSAYVAGAKWHRCTLRDSQLAFLALRRNYEISACGAVLGLGFPLTFSGEAQQTPIADLDTLVAAVEQKVIAWRRDIHQNPEFGNREFRTAKLVADHLQAVSKLNAGDTV